MKNYYWILLLLISTVTVGQNKSYYTFIDTTLSGKLEYFTINKKNNTDTFGTFTQTIYYDEWPDSGYSGKGTFTANEKYYYLKYSETVEPHYSFWVDHFPREKKPEKLWMTPVESKYYDDSVATFVWVEQSKYADQFFFKIKGDTTEYHSNKLKKQLNIPRKKLIGLKTGDVTRSNEIVYGDTIQVYTQNKLVLEIPINSYYAEGKRNVIFFGLIRYNLPNKTYKVLKKNFKRRKYNSKTKSWDY